MPKFRSFHHHVDDLEPLLPPGLEAEQEGLERLSAVTETAPEPSFDDDESAARHYMNRLLVPEGSGLERISAGPERRTDLQRVGESEASPETNTRLVFFEQHANQLRVLGGKAVVEINSGREFVSMDAQIADAPTVSPNPTLSADAAIASVAANVRVPVSDFNDIPDTALMYYQDDDQKWHLVYEVRNVPAVPPEFGAALGHETGHGPGPSPQRDLMRMTFLVDAHSGDVVVYYSETAWIDDPTECVGIDELQTQQTFFGFQNGGVFELRDPQRNIRTFDLKFTNLEGTALPESPVSNTAFDFAATNTAAVSAHVNAMRVFDFFNDVLKRKSIDDKGMELVSVVNCTYKPDPPDSREWTNAAWHQQRMWYGQVKNAAGDYDSYSRYLDVIAHELTHGVTSTTADLKYLHESGALNESFSDIFGIVVKNLNGPNPDDVSKWSWEIGLGLGKNGGPLRDLSDPTRTGQPAHMRDYKEYPAWRDGGGVHTNSGIPNHAAYKVFTAKNRQGSYIFDPKRLALLYYLTLRRLAPFASFADVPNTMTNVIKTLWAGREDEIALRTRAVVDAYVSVGIG